MIRSGRAKGRVQDIAEEDIAASGKSAKDQLLTALLIDAVSHRKAQGQSTTLRDVHKLLGIGQPVALRLMRRLENEGVARIEPNLSDAFAAEISISSAILDGLEQARKNKPQNQD